MILHFMLVLRIFDNQWFLLDFMLLMVELFHYFSLKVCLLGLLVNMYIFKLSKAYNKSLFQVSCFITNSFLKALVKIMQKRILVALSFFTLRSCTTGILFCIILTKALRKELVIKHDT